MAQVQQVALDVEGMTCAACQAHVQRALASQPGVEAASVNLMMKRAAVSFDPGVISPLDLIAAVRESGYDAALPATDLDAVREQEARDRAQQAEYLALRRKALASLAAGALAMVVSMPLMSRHALGAATVDPFMDWAMTRLSPPVRALLPWLYAVPAAVLTWTLLAVTVVVMGWAGRHFYIRAWAGLRHRSSDMNTLVAVGTGAAFLYSLAATVAPGFFVSRGVAPDVYYEAVILIIAFVLTGNALEARAKGARPPPCVPLRRCSRNPHGYSRAGSKPTFPSPASSGATSCSSGPASGCRWTGPSRAA